MAGGFLVVVFVGVFFSFGGFLAFGSFTFRRLGGIRPSFNLSPFLRGFTTKRLIIENVIKVVFYLRRDLHEQAYVCMRTHISSQKKKCYVFKMKRSYSSSYDNSKKGKRQGQKRTYSEMMSGLPGREKWNLPDEKRQQFFNLGSSPIEEQLQAHREYMNYKYSKGKQRKRSSFRATKRSPKRKSFRASKRKSLRFLFFFSFAKKRTSRKCQCCGSA